MDNALIKLDSFQQALVEAKTIEEVKSLADNASIFKAWLRKQKAGRGAINAGAEMMLRAERKLGEMLKPDNNNRHKQGDGRPKKVYQDDTHIQTYEDMGITRLQSSRWQSVAGIPDDIFETYLEITKDLSDEDDMSYITREGLLRFYVKKKTSESNIIPLPNGIYNVIYCDPPWKYDNQIESWGPTTGREKVMHYTGLEIEKISFYTDNTGREIKQCFADDAVLFLWVTNPFLETSLQVVHNWGFQYKTNIVWVKTNIKRPGSGFYVRGRHELLYICTKGSFVPDQKGKEPIGSILFAEQNDHSRKPQEIYSLIETMYPNCQYLELFARDKMDGWDSWGDEIV